MPKKTPPKQPKAVKTKKAAAPAVQKAKPIKVAKVTTSKPLMVKAAPVVQEKVAPVIKGIYFYANGKRKTSIACVRLHKDGKGSMTINGRTLENYFPVSTDQDKVLSPFRITNNVKSFDTSVKVFGGGIHSQADAVRHGISKALLLCDASLRTTLKVVGFLTRDSREKERKKYGLKRARRAPQFSKR